jgi:hypothetical protein
MHREAYNLGVQLALVHTGIVKTSELVVPAEALAALLAQQEDVSQGAPTGETLHKKDPKDPKDDATWSKSGPFAGDNLSRFGLSPEISAQYGGI